MKADDAIAMAERSNVAVMKNFKNYLIITAPFDGVIIQRNISVGALVGPSSKSNGTCPCWCCSIYKAQAGSICAEAYVDQVDLNRPSKFCFQFNARKNHMRQQSAVQPMPSPVCDLKLLK